MRVGDVTPLELTHLARSAHDQVNSCFNSIIEFYEDAETVTAANGGAFNGVPFLRKDLAGC